LSLAELPRSSVAVTSARYAAYSDDRFDGDVHDSVVVPVSPDASVIDVCPRLVVHPVVPFKLERATDSEYVREPHNVPVLGFVTWTE
jgi:hypothetical protein